MAAYTGLSASTAAVTNRFVTSVNMANGTYTIANASPAFAGGVNLTATITAVTGNDTPGTITVVGTGVDNQPLTEVITLVAAGTATGTRAFRSVTSITQAGWIINTGNDTIVIGHAAGSVVCGSSGTLYGVVVNATAAATVVLSDARGTIGTLASSIANGHYLYGPGVEFAGFLRVALTSTNDITVIHTGTTPSAMAV
jgi:hypothetical protein